MTKKKFILDNGAYLAKAGYSTETSPRLIPNCITKAKNERRRIFVGDQIDDCKDMSGLFYQLPFQKGYLINWDIESQVWNRIFGKECFNLDFGETDLVFTEPYFNFNSVKEAVNEVFFEEYQFNSVVISTPAALSALEFAATEVAAGLKEPLCTVVVDSGFSFTHIVPICEGDVIHSAAKRINVGGKLLTNHLKEVISYRQVMVMDETYVINQVKEDVCYVASDFRSDMNATLLRGKANYVIRDYVLPDYIEVKRGYVRAPEETTGKSQAGEQIIRMNNERIAVPEVLFHPSDVGVQEMGIPEAIHLAVSLCSEESQPHLYNNVVLTGGCAHFPGIRQRVEDDLRRLVPDEYDVRVSLPDNPTTAAWRGGKRLVEEAKEDFLESRVTRKEWQEFGNSICARRFEKRSDMRTEQ